MTFFKVNDPKNRDLIKEVIAKRSIIREADRRRKMGEAFEYEQLSRFFKPITQQAEKIEKGLKGLPGEIARVLPRPINITQQMQPPSAYESSYAGEDEIPEVKEAKEDDNEIKTVLPPYISKNEDHYVINNIPLNFDNKKKHVLNIVAKKAINKSPNVYDILTNINSEKKWENLNEEEQDFLGYLLANSKAIYSNEYGTEYIPNRKLMNLDQWKNIYSHIWFNRFLYITDEMFKKEKTQAKNYLKNNDNRITQNTKELIKGLLNKYGRALAY